MIKVHASSVPADKVISSSELLEWRDGLTGEPLVEVVSCMSDTVEVLPAMLERSKAAEAAEPEAEAEVEAASPAPMLADAAEDLGGSTLSLDDRMGITTVPKA